MAVLSAVTLLEWDIVVFWCMVAASIIFLLVLLATVFFQEDQTSSKYDQQQTALQHVLGQKLLPIEPSLGWKLVGVFNNLRVWSRCVATPSQSSHTLHGCCAVLDAEAEDVLAAVQNITKQREWDPSIATITQSSPPRVLDDLDTEHPVLMDVVCVTSSASQRRPEAARLGMLRSRLHHLVRLLPATPTKTTSEGQEKEIVMNRIWKVERDDSCWMFSKNKDSMQASHTLWCYFLIQPILDTSGRSVVHIIWSPSTDRVTRDASKRLAMRLAALRQYIKLAPLKLPPLAHASLQHVGNVLPVATEDDTDDAVGARRAAAENRRHGGRGTTGGEAAEGSARPRTLSRSKAKPGRKSLSPSGKVRRTVRRHRESPPGVGSGRGGGGTGVVAGGVGLAGSGDGMVNTASSSSEDTGYSDWMSNKGSLERDGKAPGVVTSEPGVVTGLMDYMRCDEEPTSLKDEELYTLANQCAAELLGLSNRVAAINVNTSVVAQKAQTRGWFFHSLAKEVVILQKNPVRGKYHCFCGKGVIRASPEDVFKAVKNPRTRFIYDNMLKKMDIINELSDKVQIVYAVHEVPQLLRKESRDFCLLQTNKIEGSSHVVAFTSVSVAECLPSEAVPRAHVMPSGWVIEPVLDNRGSCFSMVTYIVQVCIGGKNVPASFIHFLAKRVPLSVAYLRVFVESDHI